MSTSTKDNKNTNLHLSLNAPVGLAAKSHMTGRDSESQSGGDGIYSKNGPANVGSEVVTDRGAHKDNLHDGMNTMLVLANT